MWRALIITWAAGVAISLDSAGQTTPADAPRTEPGSTIVRPVKDSGLQLAENPPMEVIARPPPEPVGTSGPGEVREGFRVIATLAEFREAIRRDGQKVRLKPGIYRAAETDPPMVVPVLRSEARNEQEHIFAVTGSGNHFDLRGTVIETPVSLQSRLSRKAHVADSWHINGANNTFEGGYFRNVVDLPYPDYHVTECEFEVCNDGNTFLDCTFVIKGSVPYGYTDYYGKGGPNFGRLDKHSFMGIAHANHTRLIGCRVYLQAFGHCVHLHTVDGILIKDCFFTGALRPTNDIFREVAGRAREYDFKVMYRGERPIPRDQMIPLTEDGIRAYEEVKNVTVIDTTVERLRGCVQLLCVGDVRLAGVTVLEAGDFGYDVSSGERGNVTLTACRGDVAYNPLLNLTRGEPPTDATFEMTILNPAVGVQPTARTGLGTLCGRRCTFVLRDGTSRPLPADGNRLLCGGRHGLEDSTVINRTAAVLILDERVRRCTIASMGPVEDHGQQNTIGPVP